MRLPARRGSVGGHLFWIVLLLPFLAAVFEPAAAARRPEPTASAGAMQVSESFADEGTRLTGDSAEDPFWIDAVPVVLTGSTCGFTPDYDEMCPYGAWAPDVVYAFAPEEDVLVDISLCHSCYDTKIIIWENTIPGASFACNDDWCRSENYDWGPYQSYLPDVFFTAGNTYYIVVTGYGSDCGDYILEIEEPRPCGLSWPQGAHAEGEPECHDDYQDQYNGGCNSSPDAFQILMPSYWELTIYGESGTFLGAGNPKRDSDWYQITPASISTISFACRAEFPVQIYLLDGGNGCGEIVELGAATAAACEVAEIVETVPPGIYWLWVGPSQHEGVPCSARYAMTIDGYHDTATGVADPGESGDPTPLRLDFPNPFSASSAIEFTLPGASGATLTIYDIAGRRLRILLSGVELADGVHRSVWDGRDKSGREVGAGVYFLMLRAGERTLSRKMILLR